MRHVVKGRGGAVRRADLTPLKAIRRFCLQCMGFQTAEVRACTEATCPLWPYRLGRDPGAERARRLQAAPAEAAPPAVPDSPSDPAPEAPAARRQPGLFDK